jgi:hypothetical protein
MISQPKAISILNEPYTPQGGASVLTFPESGARESELWRPRGADEQAARGKLYDARIGKRVAPGKYRITFAHKR